MRTKEKARTHSIFLMMLFLMVVCAVPLSAKAAPNYQKIYGKILKKNKVTYKESSYTYEYEQFDNFCLLDINRDGVKELIAKPGGYNNRIVFVYTIKKGKAKLLDRLYCFLSTAKNGKYYVEYNKKTKRLILHTHGGTGLSGREFYQVKNYRIKRRLSLDTSTLWDSGNVVRTTYAVNNKVCSKKKYNKYYKKYMTSKNVKTVYMYANTAANRKKKLK